MKLKKEFIKLSSDQRLYKLEIPVIGLTGGVASGKSTVSRLFTRKAMSVIDADKLVKTIYSTVEAKKFISSNFPTAIVDGEINFPYLRQVVFKEEKFKHIIESFIYPQLQNVFFEEMKRHQGAKFIIYDVPLLFERGLQNYFDLKILVYAPKEIQRARLIARDGHIESMADQILDQQMDIEDKKKLVDVVIDNSKSETELDMEVENFINRYFES